MAKRLGIVSLFFLVLCAFSRGLSILHGTIECRSLCERTFPLHTYPRTEHYLACQQGCYRALQIEGWSVLGIHLQKCSKGCNSSYFNNDSIDACNLGCEKGRSVNVSEKEKVPSSSRKTTPAVTQQHSTVAAMILHPVLLLRSYGRGVINKLTYYVQSSTSYYFSTNDGGMVVVNIQDEPRVYVQAENQYPNTAYDEQDKQTADKEPQGYSERHESWVVVRKGHHWLHCVSHRSGVPMWILTSILFLSSFFLLWLCCATTSSSSSNKKSIKKAFLIKDFLAKEKDDQDAPLLDLNDEQQAEPLPSKTGAVITI